MRRILLLAWALAALTGCTLSFGGAEETVLSEFSGAPLVRITAPLPNTTYLTGVSVNVQVQIANAGTDIDRVEVFVDGVLIGTLPQPNPTSASAFGVTQTFNAGEEGTRSITAIAYREDGTASVPAAVAINVLAALPENATATPQPTDTQAVQPTGQVAATATLQPAATTGSIPTATPLAPAASPTSQAIILPTGSLPATSASASTPVTQGAAPIANFEGIVNVRSGPSTNFEPPIGTFQPGQQARILSVYTDGTWLKVEFGSSTGWIFAQIARVEGDISTLPREAGPPIPTARPATSTPVQPVVPPTTAPGAPTATTAPSADGANLVVLNWEMRVIGENRPTNDIASGKPAIAFVRVKNTGNQAAPGFFAVLTIVNTSDSGAKLVEAASSNGLQPGEEAVIQIGFTDTTAAGTGRAAVVRLDENNQVPETNEGDNASPAINYTLAGS